jgi:hypothetical protein
MALRSSLSTAATALGTTTLGTLRAEIAASKLLVDAVVAHQTPTDRESLRAPFAQRLERLEAAVDPIQLSKDPGQAIHQFGDRHMSTVRTLAQPRRM